MHSSSRTKGWKTNPPASGATAAEATSPGGSGIDEARRGAAAAAARASSGWFRSFILAMGGPWGMCPLYSQVKRRSSIYLGSIIYIASRPVGYVKFAESGGVRGFGLLVGHYTRHGELLTF